MLSKSTITSHAILAVKVYWILDGREKVYFQRDVVKKMKGYFVREHNSWCIDNPTPEQLETLRSSGLVIQFRKYKENNL